MHLHQMIDWLSANWFSILTSAVILEQAVKAEAEKRQNIKLISVCDHIGTVLGYITDILVALIKKTPPTQPPTTGATA